MKYFSIIISIALLMLTSTGCTRNNGDIGDWFGQWQQTEMLVDGAPDAEYHGQYF